MGTSQNTWRVWKRRMTNGEHFFACTVPITCPNVSIASRSSFLHILQMVLGQRISKRSIPMLTQPFGRIPLSSQQTKQRTGRPKVRNILPLASLWSNVRPKYRPESRHSRPVVEQWQKRTKKRKKNEFRLAECMHHVSYHARSFFYHTSVPVHYCLQKSS